MAPAQPRAGSVVPPRVIVVTRPTDLAALIVRHGTLQQATFFLQQQGLPVAELEARDRLQHAAVAAVLGAIPTAWRRAHLDRGDLDRFLFEPGDVVVAVGQDGLVANVAKYLDGQAVIGVNPDPRAYDGVLVPHSQQRGAELIALAVAGHVEIEERSMVEVALDDGQRLRALNELFVGHRTHQSARYVLALGDVRERQSSSGLIVATGTGASGWALSIARERREAPALPGPADAALTFFVREAWPGRAFGTSLTAGALARSRKLTVISEMHDGGAIFGDGIEDDRLEFGWGRTGEIGLSPARLRLVRG